MDIKNICLWFISHHLKIWRHLKLLELPLAVLKYQWTANPLLCFMTWFSIITDLIILFIGANKSSYAPEPFDVGRILQVDITSNGQKAAVTTAGPVDPGWYHGTISWSAYNYWLGGVLCRLSFVKLQCFDQRFPSCIMLIINEVEMSQTRF